MTIWSGCLRRRSWEGACKPETRNPGCCSPFFLAGLPVCRWTQACYENHFCPTGTGNPLTGQMADDAVNRGLSVEQANPFLNVDTLKYLGDEVSASGCKEHTLYR